jgi:hypothetical protein
LHGYTVTFKAFLQNNVQTPQVMHCELCMTAHYSVHHAQKFNLTEGSKCGAIFSPAIFNDNKRRGSNGVI